MVRMGDYDIIDWDRSLIYRSSEYTLRSFTLLIVQCEGACIEYFEVRQTEAALRMSSEACHFNLRPTGK